MIQSDDLIWWSIDPIWWSDLMIRSINPIRSDEPIWTMIQSNAPICDQILGYDNTGS